MTHYIIDYSLVASPQAAHEQGLKDIAEYMGEEKFKACTEDFKKQFPCGLSLGSFSMYCSLAGISGYPVRAWYDHCFPFG